MNNHSSPSKLRSYLELMRPANIITAFADILAGVAAAGVVLSINQHLGEVGWLLLATFGLYGGGVVFNDFFDAELDSQERPNRAIPSGRVSRTEAGLLGTFLLILAIIAAFLVNNYSGALAIFIALSALLYDFKAKHSPLWGPLFMGLCRGGNLLLGCSIVPALLFHLGYLALFPIVYIAAITLISQGEVHGGSQTAGWIALGCVLLVIAGLFGLTVSDAYQLLPALPFIILFSGLVLPPFFKAAQQPDAAFIRKAVKRGVLALIILNGAFAAGFGGFLFGMIVLALLPLSLLFARAFAVT